MRRKNSWYQAPVDFKHKYAVLHVGGVYLRQLGIDPLLMLIIFMEGRMIVGSGLLAKAFSPYFERSKGVCIYAAGVSNSNCCDSSDFNREKVRVKNALALSDDAQVFVYFSTCSIYDPEMEDALYVKHKLAMESLVSAKKNHIIFRLPQVAGNTPNPHTLLNYLYSRITRSERFSIWINARRNIIDVDDVASICNILISKKDMRDGILNIANPYDYSVVEIVNVFEKVLKKKAFYAQDKKGSGYNIDITYLQGILGQSNVVFDIRYLERVIEKYYGN